MKCLMSLAGGVMILSGAVNCYAAGDPPQSAVDPATLPRIGTIDERFQSYNIEMVEVTGGRFWKPYASAAELSAA
jgi:hypothetical protein